MYKTLTLNIRGRTCLDHHTKKLVHDVGKAVSLVTRFFFESDKETVVDAVLESIARYAQLTKISLLRFSFTHRFTPCGLDYSNRMFWASLATDDLEIENLEIDGAAGQRTQLAYCRGLTGFKSVVSLRINRANFSPHLPTEGKYGTALLLAVISNEKGISRNKSVEEIELNLDGDYNTIAFPLVNIVRHSTKVLGIFASNKNQHREYNTEEGINVSVTTSPTLHADATSALVDAIRNNYHITRVCLPFSHTGHEKNAKLYLVLNRLNRLSVKMNEDLPDCVAEEENTIGDYLVDQLSLVGRIQELAYSRWHHDCVYWPSYDEGLEDMLVVDDRDAVVQLLQLTLLYMHLRDSPRLFRIQEFLRKFSQDAFCDEMSR